MKQEDKRYCDECNSDKAKRYVVGWMVRYYCPDCAIKYKLGI